MPRLRDQYKNDIVPALVKQFSGSIHLVHAYQLPPQIAFSDHVAIPQSFWDAVRKGATETLDERRAKVEEAGLAVEVSLMEESPGAAILDLAERAKPDLIVMGSRGLSGVKHAFLGSVADRVVRLAPCPVMTVKEEEA